MKKYLVSLLLALSSFGVFAETTGCEHKVPFGFPTNTVNANVTDLCRIGYFVSYDNMNKIPFYVAEYLHSDTLSGVEKRISVFKIDQSLPVRYWSSPLDYKVTATEIFDKGHMAPAGDMSTDSVAMLQSFYMSNIVPQYPKNNRGIWKSLETRVRKIAIAKTELYVFTGPLVDKSPLQIGANKVSVPSHLYKVVIDKNLKECIAYIIPNTNDKLGSIKKYETSCSSVETKTGINFTPLEKSNFKSSIGKSFASIK